MGGYVEFSVYLACLCCILNFYANFIAVLGIIAHLLVFLLISCALFGVCLRFRIPKPKDSVVRNILGSDWGAYKVLSGDKTIDNDYVMKVVAHRACGLDAPENSLTALEKANKNGMTAVEFDVMVTADNIPVIFHDTNLLRLTDLNKNVNEITFHEMSQADISVKHPFGNDFKGERVPTLDQYIRYCLENQIRMFIDLKDCHKNLVSVINDLFKQYPRLYEKAIVSSFNPLLIYKIRAKDPKIACSLAWRPYYYSHEEFSGESGPAHPRTCNLLHLLFLRVLNLIHEWALWKFGYYILGLSALLLHKDMVNRETLHYWNKRGIRVIAWSVNLPTEKQYFEKILQITYLTDTAINS